MDLLLITGLAVGVWYLMKNQNGGGSSPTVVKDNWTTYTEVGETTSGIKVVVQYNNRKNEVPSEDEYAFRAAQISPSGAVTPFGVKNQQQAFIDFGRNESTEALDPNKWDVPYSVALDSAEFRYDNLSKGVGMPDLGGSGLGAGEAPDEGSPTTPPISPPPSGGAPTTFPDAASGSFQGFPQDPTLGGVSLS